MRSELMATLSLALVGAATAAAQDTAQLVLATGAPTPCVWNPACSTPGVQLVLQGSKTKMMGREFIRYGIAASGLPAGKLYTFWLYPFGGDHPIPLVTGFTGDSTGGLSCADSSAHARAGAQAARFVSRSGREEIQATGQIPPTGTFWMLLAPAVRGKKGGNASFAVTTAACSPTLAYAWGKDLN